MDISIFTILAQDGITSGAIYALLALALVLVFSVTRVIFIPQGEFVAFGALTLAAMQSDMFPHSATLLLALGVLTFVQETIAILRIPERRLAAARSVPLAFAKFILFPAAIYALTKAVADPTLPLVFQVLLTLAIVVPMGPMIYRLAFQPLAEATTLVLLIVSVGVHFALLGLGLVMFGPRAHVPHHFPMRGLKSAH
jgi:branched-chain amino acid transport system permease protein